MNESTTRPPDRNAEQRNAAIDDDADRARADQGGIERIAEAHDTGTDDDDDAESNDAHYDAQADLALPTAGVRPEPTLSPVAGIVDAQPPAPAFDIDRDIAK